MENINTPDYWDSRFKIGGNWNKSGHRQTREYAKANVVQINIPIDFNGSILDFGCALGDAIPIYKKSFPNAKIYGLDVSKNAIKYCKNIYGKIAIFQTGNYLNITAKDIIIASHVMEHLTDDKKIVSELLTKCKELFIFVPFKENPLYIEHVNYYEKTYYDNFNVLEKKVFFVEYSYKSSLKLIIKRLFRGKFIREEKFSKEIIMFHIKGLE
jgi:trans-aconitate methyltransferase